MNCPYLTIPFKFTDAALFELKNISDDLYNDFIETDNKTPIVRIYNQLQSKIESSLIQKELIKVFEDFNLPAPQYQLMIYQERSDLDDLFFSDPCVDLLDDSNVCPVSLQITIYGSHSTEVVWWDKDLLDKSMIQDVKSLGQPDWVSCNLSIPQYSASFLRTDKLHSFEIDGKKKIVLNLQFDCIWDLLQSKINENKNILTRYGHEFGGCIPPVIAKSNSVIDMMLQHKSVRRFTEQKPPFGTTELLIAAAQSSSTSGASQLWSVISVEDMNIRNLLMRDELNAPSQRQAPIFLVFCCDISRVAQVYDKDIAYLDYAEFTLLSIIDASMAAQNVMIAAQSMGMGGVYHGSIRVEPHIVITALNLPKHVFPIFGICIGYHEPSKVTIQPVSVRPRISQSVVLHYNTYIKPKFSQLTRYDTVFHKWLKSHGKTLPNWTSSLIRRKFNIDKALSKVMQKSGFFFK